MVKLTRILLDALKEAEKIVRQHNLLSTATAEERNQTIERHIDWWNNVALPAIERGEEILPLAEKAVRRGTKSEKERRFLESGGKRCPDCGCGEFHETRPGRQASPTMFARYVGCANCGLSWTEIYGVPKRPRDQAPLRAAKEFAHTPVKGSCEVVPFPGRQLLN